MSPEDDLENLLDQWEESRERGRPISAEELCRDTPEFLDILRRRIRQLEAVNGFLEPAIHGARNTAVEWSEIHAGRYRVQGRHQSGGLGEVLWAEDRELRRKVALKRLHPSIAWNQELRARFLFEAELTGRLEHPGIVPIYGLVQDQSGNPYYAMRFIDGRTLDQAIDAYHARGGPRHDPRTREPELNSLLQAFRSVCQTIAFAHSRHVVHRDIKPSNIILGDFGEVHVIDWGLAKVIPGDAATEGPSPDAVRAATQADTLEDTSDVPIGETKQGQVKGTPVYMSPEQALGNSAGPASDIYSLGATLHKLRTGQVPYSGSSLDEILAQVRQGNPAPPRQRDSSIPAGLEAICLKAMRRLPGDRYHSALDLAADIKNWLDDVPVAARRDPWITRMRRWLRKHRTVVVAGTSTILVALVLLGAFAVRLGAENAKLEHANRSLALANVREREARLDAERHLVSAFRQISDLAGIFQNPQLEMYRYTPVFRLVLDSLQPHLDELAELASTSPLGDDAKCLSAALRLHAILQFPESIDESELVSVRETLLNYLADHSQDSWVQFNLGLSYGIDAQRQVLLNDHAAARAGLDKACEFFRAAASPDTLDGRSAIALLAWTTAMRANSVDPHDPADVATLRPLIEDALDLLARAESRSGDDLSEQARLLCWRGMLLGSKATGMAAESFERAQETSRAALDLLDTVPHEHRNHPLFYRSRFLARTSLALILKPQPKLEFWDLAASAADDLLISVSLVDANIAEGDRRALWFSEWNVAELGIQVLQQTGQSASSDPASEQRVLRRCFEAVARLVELYQALPQELQDRDTGDLLLKLLRQLEPLSTEEEFLSSLQLLRTRLAR